MAVQNVSYVQDKLDEEARDVFSRLLGGADVPGSLIELWRDTQHMTNRLIPLEMDVRHMAMLVVIDRINHREKARAENLANVMARKGKVLGG